MNAISVRQPDSWCALPVSSLEIQSYWTPASSTSVANEHYGRKLHHLNILLLECLHRVDNVFFSSLIVATCLFYATSLGVLGGIKTALLSLFFPPPFFLKLKADEGKVYHPRQSYDPTSPSEVSLGVGDDVRVFRNSRKTLKAYCLTSGEVGYAPADILRRL